MSYSFTSLDTSFPSPGAQRTMCRLSVRHPAFLLAILFSLFLHTATLRGEVDKGKSSTAITLEPIEGKVDTVKFHIGSPLFLRLNINAGRACEPFNGRPFFFDASGAQVGWGFVEVTDSLLFPQKKGECRRYLMLSSENSNLLAEGYYTLCVSLLMDEKSELRSDTIVLHPVHSTGADDLSYSRFLLEQILSNSPLLQDPLTLNELFASHLPHSPASEIYHAAILYLGGNYHQAADLLKSAQAMVKEEGMSMSIAAASVYEELERRLAHASN